MNKKCPVPQDQRPMNEYHNLKKAFTFAWTTHNGSSFYKSLAVLSGSVSFIFTCLVMNNPNWQRDLDQSVMQIFLGSLVFTVLILFRFYFAWRYIYRRLMYSTVSYEESGWYDGNVWIKTPDVLIQDRLLGTYELLPIIRRLESTLLLFNSILIISMCTIIQMIK